MNKISRYEESGQWSDRDILRVLYSKICDIEYTLREIRKSTKKPITKKCEDEADRLEFKETQTGGLDIPKKSIIEIMNELRR